MRVGRGVSEAKHIRRESRNEGRREWGVLVRHTNTHKHTHTHTHTRAHTPTHSHTNSILTRMKSSTTKETAVAVRIPSAAPVVAKTTPRARMSKGPGLVI